MFQIEISNCELNENLNFNENFAELPCFDANNNTEIQIIQRYKNKANGSQSRGRGLKSRRRIQDGKLLQCILKEKPEKIKVAKWGQTDNKIWLAKVYVKLG